MIAMHRTLTGAAALLACATLAACTAATQKRATENAAVKKDVATEIDRICALPEPDRATELKELQTETGYELYCARK